MNRSRMREQAFILLFEKEFFKDKPVDEIEKIYSENVAELSDYGRELFESTVLHFAEFDEIFQRLETEPHTKGESVYSQTCSLRNDLF